MRNIRIVTFLFFAWGCQDSNQNASLESSQATYSTPAHHSENLTKVYDAHGGFEQWSKMKSLTYMKGDEKTVTNLSNRKIRLESPEQTIGFDGNEVWISPDTLDPSRARFYHNLYFYFYAMPFVVGDPGSNYEDLPLKDINGKNYKGIKVSYDQGVGDAPDDNYIIWYDPDTYQMEWLMYTVTYRSQEPSDKYNIIHYSDWGSFNGLVLPTKFQPYQYADEAVGDKRGDERVFTDISIGEEAPSDALFKMPENAVVAPLRPSDQ